MTARSDTSSDTRLQDDANPTRVFAPRAVDGEGATLVDAGEAPSEDLATASFDSRAGLQRYAQLRLLGEGGMGTVTLCHDRAIGRDVAVKRMHGHLASTPETRSRFELEARTQARLEHPSIVPVYDIVTSGDGSVFFTMKRVCGQTLEEILEQAKGEHGGAPSTDQGSIRRLLSFLSRVSAAIAYAHERGIAHRDLKPANIIVCDYGEVYVLDWGLAKLSGQPSELLGLPPEPTSANTLHGAVMGTPGYMAPEQVLGDIANVDTHSDVFSLGAILFEVLAQRRLIEGDTATALLANTLIDIDARLFSGQKRDAARPELEALCVRATQRNPIARCTAKEFHLAIEEYLNRDDITADLPEERLEKPRARHRHIQGALLGLLLVSTLCQFALLATNQFGYAAAVVSALVLLQVLFLAYWLGVRGRKPPRLPRLPVNHCTPPKT